MVIASVSDNKYNQETTEKHLLWSVDDFDEDK